MKMPKELSFTEADEYAEVPKAIALGTFAALRLLSDATSR